MGSSEPGDDEEGRAVRVATLASGPQPLHGLRGHSTIGIRFVGNLRRLERRAARQLADAVELLIAEVRFLPRQLAAFGAERIGVLNHLVVKVRNRERLRVPLVSMADMKHLAERFGAVTVLGEVLWQRDRIGQALTELAAESIQAR